MFYLHIYLYLVYAWCLWMLEEGSESPGTRIIDGCKPPFGMNPGIKIYFMLQARFCNV